MVILGIHVSDEAVAAILFAIGGLLTAFGVWIRANAKKIEANAKKIEANAKTVEADAETKVKDAEAEFAERLSLSKTLTQYGELLQSQIIINQQQKERADAAEAAYQKRLEEKEKQDENNYRVLSQTQDRHAAEIHTQLRERFDIVERKLDDLPGKLQEDNKEWMKTLVGELVTQMAGQFADLTMSQEWYPFPDVTDPEWHEDFVKPLVNKVRLYRRPVLSEASVTDVVISAGGESMKVIQGRKKRWLLVRLTRDNTEALYGWLPEHEVLTGLNAARRATGEAQAVTLTVSNSVPAT